MNNNPNYFVGVVSLEHAQLGYQGGFTQACHGKKNPLARTKKGDWFVQYSPKKTFRGKDPYQKFSFIGQIVSDEPYQVQLSPNFHPYRIDINYIDTTKALHTDIKTLTPQLSFITNKRYWGMAFRYGFLKIPRQDFALIYHTMTGETLP